MVLIKCFFRLIKNEIFVGLLDFIGLCPCQKFSSDAYLVFNKYVVVFFTLG